MKKFGEFSSQPAGYVISQLPKVGKYEYIYKNQQLLVKMDQFGVSFVQVDAPTGEALFKRENREITSPIKLYFDDGNGVFHNFDVFKAQWLNIEFLPECATYTLNFGDLTVQTKVIVPVQGKEFVLQTTFVNNGSQSKDIKLLGCCYPYVNPLLMAPWDKPEWYTKTQYLSNLQAFLTTKYSVEGNVSHRRYLTQVCSQQFSRYELSSERLCADTNNFAIIPEVIGSQTQDLLYAFEQCMSWLCGIRLTGGAQHTVTQVFAMACDVNSVDATATNAKKYFADSVLQEELSLLRQKYQNLFSVRQVNTPDKIFNNFVNGFLPLQLDWVSSLDRGWPTGMRGVRDASNDFQALLCYDQQLCRDVIVNVFSKQRSDGWYPRQIPFGNGTKFDLRGFVDSACFFTEFVYDYVAYTNDYSIFSQQYPYYDDGNTQSGWEHLKKGMEYLLSAQNVGEHGLVKMHGGDWLDCLSSAGAKGRGETVMVTCQLVMCLRYILQLEQKLSLPQTQKYNSAICDFTNAINKHAFNSQGFYNAVFTDEGNWLFSQKDADGIKRVYAPTNAYAIISGVAKGREQQVFDHLKNLRTDNGYKLFSYPLGEKFIKGIGKMGTGDFQPYFAENGSVYNHGSQGFLLRALAQMGDHQNFFDVLSFAMPQDQNRHKPQNTCAAPYAITNCYHLVPSFFGRAGFSFLTGSVAMISRAIYSWMFGINFNLDQMVICPCLPQQFANSCVTVPFGKNTVTVRYNGYGSQIASAQVNGKQMDISSPTRQIALDKKDICGDCQIQISLV